MTSQPDLGVGTDTEVRDVVGNRVLTGVQLIDISRLSAHPIPMISGGLITVAGQGPKDSNGAGKSSFIAAVSLLSADEQWRLASGAASAAELLFTAEIAAQDGRWSNVNRGFVIGVFTDPRAQDAEGWTASALSVWLRINRKAPYIDLRWREGLYVPAGTSEAERVARVDALWQAMERRKLRTDLHANRLAESLYGPHVRCVSFLSTSVRASPTANLLAQPLNELSPARIFDAIATLTGLDRELEQEQKLRSREFAERAKVAEARGDLERWEQQMAVVGAGIERRAAARGQLDHAQTLWTRHTARHVVEGHEERLAIEATTAQLEARCQERETEVRTLGVPNVATVQYRRSRTPSTRSSKGSAVARATPQEHAREPGPLRRRRHGVHRRQPAAVDGGGGVDGEFADLVGHRDLRAGGGGLSPPDDVEPRRVRCARSMAPQVMRPARGTSARQRCVAAAAPDG